MTRSRRWPTASVPIAAAIGWFMVATAPVGAQDAESLAREHAAAMAAHHLCSGTFVVGRDYQRAPDQVVAQDIKPFPAFAWRDDFHYEVDQNEKAASVWGDGIPRRTARYNGDQGCSILPRGASNVYFQPVPVPRNVPNPATTSWPSGDRDAHGTFPEVDQAGLDRALDWAMAQPQNTRALVVTYRGKIIGERYAPGFTKNTPQISWSQGKSITAALIGVLVQQGTLDRNDPAPIAAWKGPNDPRRHITVTHLLRMSSGLDFRNYGLDASASWLADNEHFRIYFDAVNVFEHAVHQPMDLAPNEQFRYRNSDPLTLGRIVKETVEARGEEYLTFPQRGLFDRIGARNFLLETDAWGNFILTGYDFGSAWDWTRFGLLHLWNGNWNGDQVLPPDWSEFVSTPAPGDPQRGYGGLFWLNAGGALDRVPADAYWAAGFMGQITMVIPSRGMVVVRLGPSPGGFNPYLNETVGRVVEAVRER
jgi:CubicO group peptidase (beta-lactamase class C family)